MASAFDDYESNYQDVVQDSIAFSGLKHDFFLSAKVDILARLFASHFGSEKPRLADIGCGVGAMHKDLAGICASISGSDVSASCLAKARAAHPANTYAIAEGAGLPWSSRAFDAALAVCVFHHVPLNERAKLISEMCRIVRPGGLALIIEHNPWNPLTQLAVARCPFDHDAILLDWRKAGNLMSSAGLDQIRSEHFLLLPFKTKASRTVENLCGRIPFGAQYVTSGVVP